MGCAQGLRLPMTRNCRNNRLSGLVGDVCPGEARPQNTIDAGGRALQAPGRAGVIASTTPIPGGRPPVIPAEAGIQNPSPHPGTWGNAGMVRVGPVCLNKTRGALRILTSSIEIMGSGIPAAARMSGKWDRWVPHQECVDVIGFREHSDFRPRYPRLPHPART